MNKINMKKWIVGMLSGMMVLAMLFVASCSEDDIPLLGNSMTATVDGNSFTAISFSYQTSAQITSITGTNTAGESITFAIQNAAVGTYDLALTAGNSGNYFPGLSASNFYTSISGSIVFTEYTAEKVVGTFNFEGQIIGTTDMVSVTNGSFDISN